METRSPAPAPSPRLPWAAWIAAAAFVLLLLPKIGAGTLWHHDELLTANRAREMLVRGDPFAVTQNFALNVNKPPLQYWVGALLLWALPGQPELAVRLPSLLAGAGCVLAAAWLARACRPEDPALAAWTALALAGCGYLIHFSRVALLDTGAALFLTLALAGYQLARRDARWHWFVALQCVLGGWQKAPYGLAAWLILLAADWRLGAEGAPPPARRWPHHLPVALAAAALGSLGWWIIQWMRLDHALLVQAKERQIGTFLRAHDLTDQGFRPWLYWVWLARDWTLLGICAPAAAVAAILAKRRDHAMFGLGLVCVLFGGVLACLAYRAERYLVVITPALAVLAVHWLRGLSARRWVLPVALASALPVAAFHYFQPAPAQPDLLAAARELARTQRPGERLLVCAEADKDFSLVGFVLFYSDLRRPLEAVPLPAVEQRPGAAGACRGICGREQWELLSRSQPTLRPALTPGDWVLWAD